jgi:hypothetical protein
MIGHGYSCNDPVGSSSTAVIKNITAHSIYGQGASMIPDPTIA